MSKTCLMIAVSFHDDASLAPIAHYTIPKMVSQRGDPTLLAMYGDLAVDVTSYAAVLSGPKTGSSALGALIEAVEVVQGLQIMMAPIRAAEGMPELPDFSDVLQIQTSLTVIKNDLMNLATVSYKPQQEHNFHRGTQGRGTQHQSSAPQLRPRQGP
eukprot:5043916-Amphidinium_carterae.1